MEWVVIPVDFRIGDVVATTAVDVLLPIIDLMGLPNAEEGGLSLLEGEVNFNGCFKRELLFVIVRFGNCDTDLLFLLKLPFGVGDNGVVVEEFECVVVVLLLSRTVAAEEFVLLDVEDDELSIKR